ncbi:GroES-like superfamily [Sesbania bispinosa]|nr:GroES-like superfamily [Sesbania bispinosa]
MARRLVPLLNRVLVEKIIPPSKTNTGILLPEKSSKLNSGKVIAVGPGIHGKDGKQIPVAVKEGDTVLLPEYGGTEVKLNDKEYPMITKVNFRNRRVQSGIIVSRRHGL